MKKKPYISIILGDNPIIAIGTGYKDAIIFNAHYLKDHASQEIDLYLKGIRDMAVILPAMQTIDTASWFALLMPVNPKDATNTPEYAD